MAKTNASTAHAPAHTPTPFGARLAECRARAQLSQRRLGDASCLSQATIASYESGRLKGDCSEIFRIADALGVDARWLSTGEHPVDTAKRLAQTVAPESIDLERIEKRLMRICDAFFQAGALFDVIRRAIADDTDTKVDLIGLTKLGYDHACRFAQFGEDLAKEVRHG